MAALFDLKTGFIRNACMVVPPVLGMSVVLGLSNAEEWSMAGILPKDGLSFGVAPMGGMFALLALYFGLLTAAKSESQIYGLLARLAIGFAGVACMLWHNQNPAN